jgi:broad specificity phosphatase PhoE
MTGRLLLVRHPPVAEALRGVCYGSSDVPLAASSQQQIQRIVDELLKRGPITHLFHSGLSRCATVADALAARCGLVPVANARLRERSLGSWELRRWDDIHAETGEAMLGMLTDPGGWRPPGGETTFELRDRVLAWYAELPPAGHLVAITHGGPIAALRGALSGRPVREWPSLVSAHGEIVTIGLGLNPPAR